MNLSFVDVFNCEFLRKWLGSVFPAAAAAAAAAASAVHTIQLAKPVANKLDMLCLEMLMLQF